MSSVALAWQALRVYIAHYRKAPLQAGAILLGVILAVTLLVGVKATNDNAVHSYQDAGEALGAQASLFLSSKSRRGNIDENSYFALKSAGITAMPVLSGDLDDADGRPWHITGSDVIAALAAIGQHSGSNASATPEFNPFGSLPLDRLLAGAPLVVMSQSQFEALGFSKVTAPKWLLGGIELTPIALPDSSNLGHRLFMDISLAQQLLGHPQQLSYIALFGDAEQLQPQLAQLLPLNELLITAQDKGQALTDLTASFHLNLNAMAMLAFLVGLFIAYNGVRYSLMKRQRLLIQLMQQGIGRQAIFTSLLAELFLLVLVGSGVGFILALQLSQWLQPMVALTLEQLYGATLLPGQWRWQWWAQGAGLTLVAALLACVPLYRSLSSGSLAQGGKRYLQAMQHHLTHHRLFLIGVGLLILTAVAYPFSQQHKQSLGLLGLLTLAIPLLLPQLLQWGLALLAPLTRPGIWRYAIAESRELIAPLGLAMMALLLALCANISMNTLVGSFDQTLRSWLSTRLHADLYLHPGSDNVAPIETFLRQQHPELTYFYQWQAPYFAKAQTVLPINLIGRDDESLAETTVFKLPNTSTEQQAAVSAAIAGKAVFISEPLSLKLKLKVGDNIRLCSDNQCQQARELPVAAIYFDYGNPKGEVIISPPLWHGLGLPAEPIGLALGQVADIDTMTQELEQQFGLNPAQIYSQQRIRNQAFAMFNKTFSITLVLNTLTLLVAAIGLFSAVLMMTQSRQAPLAMLRALGVEQSRLWRMLLAQIVLVVLLTCVLALPLGAILGYLLINKVTLQAFGWTIAMQWDWWAYARVVLLSLLCAIIAVILPLYWQSRRTLVSAMQQEVM
ncbi:FtsX-like permease family protein [Shewanella avicenniae]|uniref:FtsX-like permease family protein n=1 Tax=Shewanella avicenniae TaxID=2814294 RepID=A0ABX7QNJ3_9GAMM|nr:FtsX-like permease family protein [Shewanella avicenniae]QSX32934.1 FtsX-like permease family protein [Shewanella avicenniae]